MAKGDRWRIEVPIDAEGGASSGTGELKELNKNVKKLDKTMFLNVDVIEALSSIAGSLFKVIQPLFKLLGILLVVIFLPLMPLLKSIIEALEEFVSDVADAGGGLKGLVSAIIENFDADEFIGLAAILAGMLVIAFGTGLATIGWSSIILGIVILYGDELAQGIIKSIGKFWAGVLAAVLVAASSLLLFAFGGWLLLIAGGTVAFAIVFWDKIKQTLKDMALAFLGIGSKIKQKIVDSFKVLYKIGQIIVDAVKDAVSNLGSFVSGFFGGPKATGGPVASGTSYLVGEKGPEIFTPSSNGNIIPNNKIGGNTTIQINNPIVRKDSDIKMIANEVSKVMQRQLSGRISTGI